MKRMQFHSLFSVTTSSQSPLGADVNYYSLPIQGVVDLSPDVASILETLQDRYRSYRKSHDY